MVTKLGRRSTDRNIFPWWVNAITKVGAPVAIACYLVWFLTNRVESSLAAIDTAVVQHVQDQQNNIRNNRQMLQLLRVICIEGAKSVDERNECLK